MDVFKTNLARSFTWIDMCTYVTYVVSLDIRHSATDAVMQFELRSSHICWRLVSLHISVIEGESSQQHMLDGYRFASHTDSRTCLVCLDDCILDGLCESPTWALFKMLNGSMGVSKTVVVYLECKHHLMHDDLRQTAMAPPKGFSSRPSTLVLGESWEEHWFINFD